MNQRTFEILGHWIARQNKIKVTFQANVVPRADIKNNEIIMPSDIPEEHVFNALTTLMHEAAHLNYTKKDIPKGLVKDQLAHELLNVMEDIRIDNFNMDMLWNIGAFYKRAVPYDVERRKPLLSKTPVHKKVLVNAIYTLEGLREGLIHDKQAEALSKKKDIIGTISAGVDQIRYREWSKVKATIEKLIVDLGLTKFPRNPIKQMSVGGLSQEKCPACGDGGGGKEDKNAEKKGGASPGSGKDAKGGKESGAGSGDNGDGNKCPVCSGSGQADCNLRGLKGGYERSGSGQGTGTGVGNSVIGEVALREITKQTFKELLNIAETRKVEEMTKLNTENLVAFFTEDLPELFYDEVIIKKKKSKILILVDASGSMDTTLICGHGRKAVVGGCVKELAAILTEVCDYEGLNVQWDIAAFTEGYKDLNKERWEEQYSTMSGGTNLLRAFNKAQDKLLEDPEVDGNRLMVVFTDGEVNDDEIAEMKKRIIQHGEDVRCMVIGVGASLTSYFVEHIVKDLNIIAKESADLILLDTIMTMLD